MKKILIVVDMQQDFINGSLGSEDAVKIVPNVVEKIKEYKSRGDLIITTQDTHYDDYLETFEGKRLPIKHCIANTDGWQLDNDVWDSLRGYSKKYNILKTTFGSTLLRNYLKDIVPENIKEQMEVTLEICGLCLDICVLCNAILLRTAFPNAHILLDAKCTAATSKIMFENAISVLKSCLVEVVNE